MDVVTTCRQPSNMLKVDVTAVKIFGDTILAGIGSWIYIYSKHSKKLLLRKLVLIGQKIYGFKKCIKSKNLIIFGGKQFAIYSIVDNEEAIQLFGVLDAVVCDDWIHDAAWVTDTKFALLSAHNVVQIRDTSSDHLMEHPNKNNSILYSGRILPLVDDVLVMAGTVFSEVIIHRLGCDDTLHTLKGHKGVIFSISYDIKKKIIVTTSDDRSMRVWGPTSDTDYAFTSSKFWDNVEMSCKHELYGHSARVMRSFITAELITSVGEDGALCFWDHHGKLLKKNMCHQNGCIWAVDGDETDIVTGGGDGGLIIHPISSAYEFGDKEEINIDDPKKVLFTARRNVIVLKDDELVYYDVELKRIVIKYDLEHESTFKLMSMSSCKQIIAVADMKGNFDVFTENCKGEPILNHVKRSKLDIGNILSMHFVGNRKIVLCCNDGKIVVLAAVKNNDFEEIPDFVLPQCKERWLTAAACDSTGKLYVVGDRCGNIHVYTDHKNPVKSFNKIHGRYGPTSIKIRENKIITTGRSGSIKHFCIDNLKEITFQCSLDVNFEWVEKFLDENCTIVCGFQERIFVVSDLKNNKILDVPCGGGHRSWDAIRYIERIKNNYEEVISLVYLKNSLINLMHFQLSKIASRTLVSGTHTKEINCLKSVDFQDYKIFVSGGEETMLRISIYNRLERECTDEMILKHLSSIKSVRLKRIENNKYLLLSAGGRAQICIKYITINNKTEKISIDCEEITDFMIKGTDKERKGNNSWRNHSIDFDSETRIMDVEAVRNKSNEFVVFAACSDALIRIYNLDTNILKLKTQIKHHATCLTKLKNFIIKENEFIFSCTTRGEIALWNIDDIINKETDIKPIYSSYANKSGVNSIDVKVLSRTNIIVATGGEDNCIYLNLLKFEEKTVTKLQEIVISNWHCSQITGIEFIDNILVSTSIDQRVTLGIVKVDEDHMDISFDKQYYSDVADIQGMEVIDKTSESASICVFGKGLEVLEISLHS